MSSKASNQSASPSPASTSLLTPKQAAQALSLSVSWLAKRRLAGDGPTYVKMGGAVRYTESALLQWMKSRQRISTSES
jgi:predicted DNA-binding transcriptional regulator AlpA